MTFRCPGCGWKHTSTVPQSDVLLAGVNHFDSCPRCGGVVERRAADLLEQAAARVNRLLGKRR